MTLKSQAQLSGPAQTVGAASARAAAAVADVRQREGRAANVGVPLGDIVLATSAFYAQPTSEITSPRRDAPLCRCRGVIACIAREHTAMTFSQIGRRLKRGHPSVIASCAAIARLRASGSKEIEADLAAIRNALGIAPRPP